VKEKTAYSGISEKIAETLEDRIVFGRHLPGMRLDASCEACLNAWRFAFRRRVSESAIYATLAPVEETQDERADAVPSADELNGDTENHEYYENPWRMAEARFPSFFAQG
jgi:hypothetical protein